MNIEQFKQQPEDVQARVLEKNRDWNVDYGWCAYLTDQLKEELSELSIFNVMVHWSGFWSQGDGASFNGNTSDLCLLCAKIPELNKFADIYQLDQVSMSWQTSGSYCHEHSLRFEVLDHRYAEDSDEPMEVMRSKLIEVENKRIEELEEAVTSWVKDRCRKLYDDLEEEYEYLTSDEQVLESLECNDALEDAVNEAREALDYELLTAP